MAKEEDKSPKISPTKAKTFVPNLSIDTMKVAAEAAAAEAAAHASSSTRKSTSIPSSPIGIKKSPSVRQNCLCSPTTHEGSFRCRYHRNNKNSSMGGLKRNSMSVGSKLCDLTGENTEIVS